MIVERVVFLPGASGDASFWAPVAERLPHQLDKVLLAGPGLGNGVDVRRFGAADWRPDYRREYPTAPPWICDVSIDLTDRIPITRHLQ